MSATDDVLVDLISEFCCQFSAKLRIDGILFTYHREAGEGAMFGASLRELELMAPCWCVVVSWRTVEKDLEAVDKGLWWWREEQVLPGSRRCGCVILKSQCY
jgi:hypothetical protein